MDPVTSSLSFWQILPNLGTAGVAIAGLVYVVIRNNETVAQSQDKFLKTLDDRADKHEIAMRERENAMRNLESNVRASLTDQLTKNTIALTDVAKVMGRVVRHMDEK